MMPVVFFLARLKPGVDPAKYERFVREVDYPTARTFPSIISYTNHRLTGPFRKADVHYDYLEVIQVSDLEAYRADLNFPAAQKLRGELMTFLEPSDNFVGEPL